MVMYQHFISFQKYIPYRITTPLTYLVVCKEQLAWFSRSFLNTRWLTADALFSWQFKMLFISKCNVWITCMLTVHAHELFVLFLHRLATKKDIIFRWAPYYITFRIFNVPLKLTWYQMLISLIITTMLLWFYENYAEVYIF